jgi:fructokinase
MKRYDLIAFGEAVLDLFPDRRGPYDGVSTLTLLPGGAPANVAQGVASAGLTVLFLGKVGADPLGDALVARMARRGVDVSRVVRAPHTPTGATFVQFHEDGEHSFFPYHKLAADKEVTPEDIPQAPFQGARVVHLSANCMSLPPAWEATLKVLALAEGCGALISFDPNLRRHYHLGRPEILARVRALAERAHLVKMNREEAGHLYGGEEQAARALLAGRPAWVVVTRDRDGAAWWHRSGARGELPGHAVQVVDTTGAGDAFTAGVLISLLRQVPGLTPAALEGLAAEALGAAAELGNHFGATCVTCLGATAQWPHVTVGQP